MLNREALEHSLADFPLFSYGFIEPKSLEFTQRVRYICSAECPMYGQSWACPPAVGEVDDCREKCLQYRGCLMISTITEVRDISNIQESLATRGEHEAITNAIAQLMKDQGVEPYNLSTEACAECPRCAYLDGQPCRYPERMHASMEAFGLLVTEVCQAADTPYYYGPRTLTYSCCVLFGDEEA